MTAATPAASDAIATSFFIRVFLPFVVGERSLLCGERLQWHRATADDVPQLLARNVLASGAPITVSRIAPAPVVAAVAVAPVGLVAMTVSMTVAVAAVAVTAIPVAAPVTVSAVPVAAPVAVAAMAMAATVSGSRVSTID